MGFLQAIETQIGEVFLLSPLASKSVVSMLSVQTANEADWPIAGGSTIGIAVNGTVIAT